MRVDCEKCEAFAELWPGQANLTNASLPNYHFLCRTIYDRAARGETVSLGEITCPHILAAIRAGLSQSH